MPLRSRARSTEEKAPADSKSGGAKAAGKAAGKAGSAGRPGSAAGKKAPAKAEKKSLGTRVRELPGRVIGRTPWLRRRYARMMLRSIAKRRRKGKPLPDELLRLERDLRHLAPGQREQAIEQALEYSASPPEAGNRAMRRAAGRPERHSGKGTGRRPGQPVNQPRPRRKP